MDIQGNAQMLRGQVYTRVTTTQANSWTICITPCFLVPIPRQDLLLLGGAALSIGRRSPVFELQTHGCILCALWPLHVTFLRYVPSVILFDRSVVLHHTNAFCILLTRYF